MATQKYWLWLSERRHCSKTDEFRILEHFGTPEAAYFADAEEYRMIEGISQQSIQSLCDKSLDQSERILEDCDRLDLRIMTFQDADYPDRLKNIYDPPILLYIKGKVFAFDDEVAIGIVGTRKPSPYGVRMAGKLGLELARCGALVVSGIAQGVDSTALQAALRGGGQVVSVLAGGINVIYPSQNGDLYADVAAAGALISEYPPGTEHRGSHFPLRNRIISGLSIGVVTVEAEVRSGTMITARYAIDQDRDLFAVPGPADAPMSTGTNHLIKIGAARLVENGRDILTEYENLFPHKLRLGRSLSAKEEAARLQGIAVTKMPDRKCEEKEENHGIDAERQEKEIDNCERIEYIDWKDGQKELTDDQRDILLALGNGMHTIDDLIELTQIPARRVLSAMTLLQIKGYVTEQTGKRFKTRVMIIME
jgi:DNA processing protein